MLTVSSDRSPTNQEPGKFEGAPCYTWLLYALTLVGEGEVGKNGIYVTQDSPWDFMAWAAAQEETFDISAEGFTTLRRWQRFLLKQDDQGFVSVVPIRKFPS